MCNEMVGKNDTQRFMGNKNYNSSQRSSMAQERFKPRQFFPFKQGHLSVATLRVGAEGLQMTVDGKHITSFAYREVVLIILFSVS